MTYRGKVQGGVVVLDPSEQIADGTVVEVTPLVNQSHEDAQELAKSLLDLAGKAKGLPADAALNHDHYLYGLPKK